MQDKSVELLKNVRADVPILEVITDHGTEFINNKKDENPCLDHEFECYLHEQSIEHTLCKVGRPQSNRKLERFFQTYESGTIVVGYIVPNRFVFPAVPSDPPN